MVMLSIVLSLQILSMDKDTMIILPKLGKDKYCKLKGSSYIAYNTLHYPTIPYNRGSWAMLKY